MSDLASVFAFLRERLAPGAALCADHRALRPGDAFLAWPGRTHDGRRFIGKALEAGAAAVLAEAHDLRVLHDGRLLAVDGLQALAGPLAAAWAGAPTDALRVIAFTGTNGKTSCSRWAAQLLSTRGAPCAVVGTLGTGLFSDGVFVPVVEAGLTTPDALALQQGFARLRDAGATAAAIEASSIGLDQGRLAGSRIRGAVFTNLTRDHLDYHGDMDAYAEAKARLFAWPGLEWLVVNADDPAASRMRAAAAPGVRRIGVGRTASPADHDAVLIAKHVEALPGGMRVEIDGSWGRMDLTLSLLGAHNVENALCVLAAALAEGMAPEAALAGLRVLQPVPGRLQAVPAEQGPLVVVDYAHTPDALAQALSALAPVARARDGRLLCLFGAGGDRDRGKRPLMGEVACRLADAVVLASDNPRGEDPESILDQIRAGMPREPLFRDADRARAIARLLAQSSARDVVLLAGKGHENYQETAGVKRPYSDIDTAAAALATWSAPHG